MPSQFKLPDVGEVRTEAEIISWHVAVGEVVAINQVLLEVETAPTVGSSDKPLPGSANHHPRTMSLTAP